MKLDRLNMQRAMAQRPANDPRRIRAHEDDEDDQALQAIYDVDGAIRNFNHNNGRNVQSAAKDQGLKQSQYNSKKKNKDIDVEDAESHDSGIDMSGDESNHTEVDRHTNLSDTMQSK